MEQIILCLQRWFVRSAGIAGAIYLYLARSIISSQFPREGLMSSTTWYMPAQHVMAQKAIKLCSSSAEIQAALFLVRGDKLAPGGDRLSPAPVTILS